MPKSKSKANCHTRAAQAVEPAIAPGAQQRENRRTDRPPDRNHQSRRAKATTWDATECLRSAERACNWLATTFLFTRVGCTRFRVRFPRGSAFSVHPG